MLGLLTAALPASSLRQAALSRLRTRDARTKLASEAAAVRGLDRRRRRTVVMVEYVEVAVANTKMASKLAGQN
eukprot:2487009-Prymnesium_polylepis.1